MHINLKIALRNARKNSVLSFAKLFGLSISIAIILFAARYVYYETSFDKCIPDYDKIYRCLMQGKLNGQYADFAVTSPEMGKALVNDLPEVTEYLRIRNMGEASVRYLQQNFDGGPIYYADANFFSFWGIPVQSIEKKPYTDNNHLAIAKSTAMRIFGTTENVLGKTVEIRNQPCIITAIFDDVPKNFHLQLKMVQSLQKSNPENIGWGSQSFLTYFKTNSSNLDLDELNFKICKTVYTHYDDRINGAAAKTMNDLKYLPDLYLFYISERLTDIRFSNHKFDSAVTSSKIYFYGAIILSVLILIISLINFINLNIANISTRFKEIGTCKVAGAGNKQLLTQYLFESVLFVMAAFLLALIMYQFVIDIFDQFLGLEANISHFTQFAIGAITFLTLIIFIVAVNFFPVLHISNKPILNLIKGNNFNNKNLSGKNLFVLLQFSLSAIIILCSLMVHKQVDFMASKHRGYDTDNVIMFTMFETEPQIRQSFIDELKTHSEIQSVSTSDVNFGYDFSMTSAFFERISDNNYFHTSLMPVDAEFLNTFNFELKEGRKFNPEMASDYDAVIINEAAAKLYAGKGSLLNKNIVLDKPFKVIGIAKDFNYRSFYYPVQPLVITCNRNLENLYVKVQNKNIQEVIGILNQQWEKFNIPVPLKYEFHNNALAKHYEQDQKAKRLLLVLSVISIIIACVGLYAISYFTIIRRTKEIGIRKAAGGANILEILLLLNRDIVKYIVIAYLIANPIAWYLGNQWLQNFAFRIQLSWWLFALAGIVTLLIAILTVGWLSWLAARKNPVEALRYE